MGDFEEVADSQPMTDKRLGEVERRLRVVEFGLAGQNTTDLGWVGVSLGLMVVLVGAVVTLALAAGILHWSLREWGLVHG